MSLCAACAGSGDAPAPAAFPAAALASLKSDSGALSIEVRTSPSQPPTRGAASVEYIVRDVDGAPVDGLSLVVVPWMPAHGHGASVRATVAAQGGGRYLITGVSLFMAGHWELRSDFSGPRSDHVAPSFEVE